MPLTKKPLTRQWFYNASYGANDYREREETYVIKTSSLEALFNQLENFVCSGDYEQIKTLLNSEFVHQAILEETRQSKTHNQRWTYPYGDYGPDAYKQCLSYQRDTYINEIHHVQPVLEAFVSMDLKRFNIIFKTAETQKNGSLEAILSSFSNKEFLDADFSDLHLSHADFSNTRFQNVIFGPIDEADFTNADLTLAPIAKDLLYTTKTYQGAKLAKDYWPYWTPESKTSILNQIAQLQKAALTYKTSNPTQSETATRLATDLAELINAPNTKYHEKFQRELLEKLHSCDKDFQHAPLLKAIVANIILFILSAGIGYGIAVGMRAYSTQGKQILFFNQTSIEKTIAETEQTIQACAFAA